MKTLALHALVPLVVAFLCQDATGIGRDGYAGEPESRAIGPAARDLSLEKASALMRRAETMDRLGKGCQASHLRMVVGEWEKAGPLPSRPSHRAAPCDPAATPRVRRSGSRTSFRSSLWGEDVVVYPGDYAYSPSVYGNSFALDYDSSGNLFAAVGLADSSIHIFSSTDLGVTWTDEMTVTTAVPELQTRVDLVASDDGDSTLLNLFYLYPGSGNLVDVKIDYSSWTALGWTALHDTVNSYWVVQDQYWNIDYFLHTVYSRYDTLYYTWSEDRGSSWYPPLRIGSGFQYPCITYGGYSGEGRLYVSGLWLPWEDTTSLWVRTSSDYGSTWGMWQLLYGGGTDSNDVLDAVLASTHATLPSSQTVHALMCVDYGNSGDYNLWVRTSTDGGSVWSSRPGIAFDSTRREHLPSIGVHRAEDESTFFCAYYMDDSSGTTGDSVMFVFTETDNWEADKPGYSVNDSSHAPGIRPQVAFAGSGLPGTGYAGSDGRNIYYDNIWFVGAEEEVGPAGARTSHLALSQNSPNPFRSSTSLTCSLPVRGRASVRIYDVAGRFVRTLFDGIREAGSRTTVWDGRDAGGGEAPAGIYICRLESRAGSTSRKVVLAR